jgi:sugar lactone lactonase YvrE
MNQLHRLVYVLLILLLVTGTAGASEAGWNITTVAGNGRTGEWPNTSGALGATDVPVDLPFGAECGPDGALYVTSVGQHRVLRVDLANGELMCVAGTGRAGHSGDGGPATDATLNEPYEVRFDAAGHYMYFVEMKNNLVRRVDLHTGSISTIAGVPEEGFAGDGGPATNARLKQPHSIALDDRGQLYVADIGNHRIRAIDLATGTIRTIVGTGERKLPADGAIAEGQPILGPRALHVVGRTMWIALREGNSIWSLDLDTGRIRHVAGSGRQGYSGDGGPLKDATFNGPKGIAATTDGVLYVVDTENQVIRRIDTDRGEISTIAGRGPAARGFAVDRGRALDAEFDRPHGIGIGPDGSLYVGDTSNHRVRRIWLD